jgi:hypothetical protein
MYKANYDNNIRRKRNSNTYKYRCEASEALGRCPLRPLSSTPLVLRFLQFLRHIHSCHLPDDGGSKLLRNVSHYLSDYMITSMKIATFILVDMRTSNLMPSLLSTETAVALFKVNIMSVLTHGLELIW